MAVRTEIESNRLVFSNCNNWPVVSTLNYFTGLNCSALMLFADEVFCGKKTCIQIIVLNYFVQPFYQDY